jgi:hypothetical protein
MHFSRQLMDVVDASESRRTGQRHQDPCYAEATGGKFHMRLSIAWRGALAPINNASPNGEMA